MAFFFVDFFGNLWHYEKMSEVDINKLISKSNDIRPAELIISDLKWKYLVRAVLRNKNIMLVGPSGCAKTMTAKSIAKALNRPCSKFNIGSTQDARATLIGNTTYKKETGTAFHKSEFVKSITTPNMVIILDEFTRGTHDAWNILLPVIDPIQRCLRLDEDENSSIIDVAEGVSFIATANIGNEYTATRVLDKAMSRRFPIKIEMELLSKAELKILLDILFHPTVDKEVQLINILCNIYEDLIIQSKIEDASISTVITPANMVEMIGLVTDGFTLDEIAEAAIYPEFPDDSADSERSFVKSLIQKYMPNDATSPLNNPVKKKPNV